MKVGSPPVVLIAAILLFGVLLTTPGMAQQPSPPRSPQAISVQVPAPTEPPLPSGPAPDLDLVFTAQVAGWIEPCG